MQSTPVSFSELGLSAPILSAITELGFEKPSAIQAQALPLLLDPAGTDFIGLAATGTGKTAAFAIPLLEKLDPAKKGVQALILCPTRELAMQVAGQITLIGKQKGVRALAVYGGSSFGDQCYGLKRGAQVVVGTPGRLCDHLDRGTLSLDALETLVLDEADEMITMGFKDDLEKILDAVPAGQGHRWLFSATMSNEVRKMADGYLCEPKLVQVNRTEMLSGTIEEFYYLVPEDRKPEVLTKLIEAAEGFYGLVFCQTKALVVDLTQYLREQGVAVDCLHGDMDQNARERTLRAYRERKVTLLVCTDVASRGIDVKDITHVVNYSIPRELDSYVHRIGRTGRSGKQGIAMSLVTGSQRYLIGRVERMTRSKMKEGKVPSRKEIASKKVTMSLAEFQNQPDYARAVELMDPAWREALFDMPAEEIAGRFLAMIHADLVRKGPDQGAQTAQKDPAPKKMRDSRGEPREAQGRERPYGNKKPWRDHKPQREDRGPRREAPQAASGNPWRPKRLGPPQMNSGY